MLIVLSGTKSNRGIKFIPWLGRCNPRSALIAFPGTRAWAKAISYPESSGFLVSGATPWGHQFNRFFWLVMPFLTEVEYQNKFLHFHWVIPHLFERLFLISWENNSNCHITMPLSLKTMEVQIKGDQWNKRFKTVQVYCFHWLLGMSRSFMRSWRKLVLPGMFQRNTFENWCLYH